MCMACASQIDAAKADAFAERMIGMLNSAGLALMISIGHRTGLFDAMAGMALATSAEIAEAAGLNERYVREWLGAMVTGGSSATTRPPGATASRPSTPAR
jgi:hypothetical protein